MGGEEICQNGHLFKYEHDANFMTETVCPQAGISIWKLNINP